MISSTFIDKSWIPISLEKPPIKTKVQLLVDNHENNVTTGWMHESGLFSIKHQKGMRKFPKATHWKLLKN